MPRQVPPKHNGSQGNGKVKPVKRRGRPVGSNGTSGSRQAGSFLLPYPTDRKLTPLEAKLVAEFIKEPTATLNELGRRAGYRDGPGLSVSIHEVMGRPQVQAELKDQMHALTQKTRLSPERMIRHLMNLAEVDKREYYDAKGNLKPIPELTKLQAALIEGIEEEELWDGRGKDRERTGTLRKIKLTGHLEPIKLLAKSLQAFADVIRVDAKLEKQETITHNVNIGINLNLINELATPEELKVIHNVAQRVQRQALMDRGNAVEGEVVQ